MTLFASLGIVSPGNISKSRSAVGIIIRIADYSV
jgi:hypothetical protein